jgi:hypothetical protein
VLGAYVLGGHHWAVPMPMLRVRAVGAGFGPVFLLGVTGGIASACCAPVLAGVVATSALAGSVVGALGLGLAYVFGMVFPLLLAALLWDRAQLESRMRVLRSLPRVRVRDWSVAVSDAVASAMFIVIGMIALGLAMTGQSTYTPDVLAGWSRWATAIGGLAAVVLRAVPMPVEALVLGVVATGIGAAVYAAWRSGPQH